ncbi:MAG: aldehyde dehydrogenase family protein, partial [Planctomycetota bacterium]
MPTAVAHRETVAREIGLELWRAVLDARPLPLDADWWDDRLLERVFADRGMAVQLLRFVAVAPSLRSSRAVVRQLRGLHRELRRLEPRTRPLVASLDDEGDSLVGRAVAVGAKLLTARMAKRFSVDVDDIDAAFTRADAVDATVTLRPTGHVVTTAADAEAYVGRLLEVLERVGGRPGRAGTRLAVDPVSLVADLRRADGDGRRNRLGETLGRVVAAAAEIGVGVELGPGDEAGAGPVGDVLSELRERFPRAEVTSGVTAGADGLPADCSRLACRVPEPDEADAAAYAEADRDFVARAVESCGSDRVPAFATADPASIGAVLAAVDDPTRCEFEVPFGVGESLAEPLATHGAGLRLNVPVGDGGAVLAAEARRLLDERPAGRSLRLLTAGDPRREPRQNEDEDDPLASLLMSPAVPESPALDDVPVFTPEPRADFADETTRASMTAALEEFADGFGRDYLAAVDGRAVQSRRWVDLVDPAAPKTVVGRLTVATPEHATSAVESCRSAAASWGRRPAAERVELVELIAAELRLRRYELAAALVYEGGWPWDDADGEVAGAIDRLRLAASAVRDDLSADSTSLKGTSRDAAFRPKGVMGVIPSAGGPLAATAGYVAAAVVTGNTAVVCPEVGGTVAVLLLAEIARTAGLPAGVVNVVPRSGPGVAAAVAAGDIDLLAVDGGVDTYRETVAAVCGGGRLPWTFGEAGRSGVAIVDEDADVDAAVRAIAADAFGAAGRRPYAVSRVAVVRSRADAVLSRLAEVAAALPVGPASEATTVIGPTGSPAVAKAFRTAAEAAAEHG